MNLGDVKKFKKQKINNHPNQLISVSFAMISPIMHMHYALDQPLINQLDCYLR
ncbi:hypothetical protein Glove_325g8 [Diversispora epigaea]|uniref:Uncharacterized protein n=1 Tax=Diversispora epigaea TaxID=1348612 RepID=A0A397HMK5_9GLOM|nr:hypothetical protein Glove_325g8 [Diversispora epigaea]